MFESSTTFASLVDNFVGLINKVIPILVGLTMAAFFAGLIRYIYDPGDAHGKSENRKLLWWGLIALFVLTSLWGILALMHSIFLGGVEPYQGSSGLF